MKKFNYAGITLEWEFVNHKKYNVHFFGFIIMELQRIEKDENGEVWRIYDNRDKRKQHHVQDIWGAKNFQEIAHKTAAKWYPAGTRKEYESLPTPPPPNQRKLDLEII